MLLFNYTSIGPKEHKSSLRHVHRFLCFLIMVCAVFCVMSIERLMCYVQNTKRQSDGQSGRQSGRQSGGQGRVHVVTRSHRALGDRVGHKVQDKLGNKVGDKVGDIHAVTRSHRAHGDRVRD